MLSAAIIAIALSVVACGGDDAPAISQTPNVTAIVSPIPSPLSSPTQIASTPSTALATQKPLPTLAPTNSPARLIYTTGPLSYEGLTGPLWISDIAGSRTLSLTPDGVSANFAGMTGDPLNETGSLYYVAGISDDTASIYRITFPTGAAEHVLDFTPWDARFATAALSPDEHYIAYADRYGLQLLDLQTYEVLELAAGNPDPNCNARSCLIFSRPVWSPDGSRITVHESFYESGQIAVVDPSSPGAEPTDAGGSNEGNWSPDSSATCSWGGYDAPTGLYVSTGPSFTTQNYFVEFNSPPPSGPSFGVYGCDWLNDHTVVVAIRNYSSPTLDQSYAELVDTMGGSVTKLTDDTPGKQCCDRVLADPSDGLVFAQYTLSTADPNVSTPSQPEAINVATSQAYSTLAEGDWIVAVVAP